MKSTICILSDIFIINLSPKPRNLQARLVNHLRSDLRDVYL